MTELDDPTTEADQSGRSNKTIIAIVVVIAVLAIAAFAVWYFLIRDDSPATVDSEQAAEAREQALEEAADGSTGTEDGTASDDSAASGDSAATDDTAASDETSTDGAAGDEAATTDDTGTGLDGVWTVDTTIGTFDEVCLTDVCDSTFVGFRIDEELASIGAKTVVGRTPGVTGTIEIAGTTITATEIEVDMTQLITDSSSRNNAIRGQAIETDAFPTASFVLTEPVELGALPADGEQVAIEATGDLTIHGVTRSETIPLTAELAGDVVVVFGQLGPILLADYDISEPSAAVVLSVEDNAIMELQLFLTR